MSARITIFMILLLAGTANAKNAYQSILDSMKANKVKKAQIAGAVFTVKQDGKIKTHFQTRLKGNTAKKSKNIIHIASSSKQFTGAAIAYLESKGKLRLSDRVSKYIRAWPKYAKHITIEHLIRHRSGLENYTSSGTCIVRALRGRSAYEAQSIVKWIARQKGLEHKTGTYHYNNSGYVALARIVENISGLTFPQFMAKKFFRPLGMKKTTYRPYRSRAPKNVVKTYSAKGRRIIPTACTWISGDGGVHTNINDLKKWGRFLAGRSSLGSKIPALMTKKTGTGYGYGLHLNKSVKGMQRIAHNGNFGGAYATIQFVPEKSLFSVVLVNNGKAKDIGKIGKKLLNQYLKSQ